MKKIKFEDIIGYYLAVIVTGIVIWLGFLVYIEIGGLALTIIIAVIIVGLTTPFTITWFWNKYIAKEDEDESDKSS